MDYSKLIVALRACSIEPFPNCRDCMFHKPGEYDCVDEMDKAAADAIEELQQVATHYSMKALDYYKEAREYKEQLRSMEEVQE